MLKDLSAPADRGKIKVLSASRGGGDVHPGQVEAPDKVLLTLE